MENLYFNIPTVISHSYFTLSDETIHLSEKEINFFYSLLYLFRENMKDESKVKIFEKKGKFHSVSDDFKNITVRIELSQFNDLGVVSKHSYKDLKTFIKKLQNRRLVINSLGKDKRLDIQPTKMIEDYKIEDNILHLTLDEDFLFMFLHTDKYFMKVDLNILFKIKGYKSKKLYLIIKDYSQFKNECIRITKENLENLIGRIPSKKRFENDIDNTHIIKTVKNKVETVMNTDLKIEYPTVIGRKLKKYEFRFKDLVEKETEKPSQPKKEKIDEIDSEVMKESEKKLQQRKNRKDLPPIDDEEGYKHKIYNEMMEKKKPQPPKEKTEDDVRVEEWIQTQISMLKKTENIQFQYNNYLMLCIEKDKRVDEFFIDDDYKVYKREDYKKQNPITSSSEVTNSFLELYEDEIIPKVFCGYGNNLTDKTTSEIRRE